MFTLHLLTGCLSCATLALQIIFEGMLEDVNNVLNSGDVPNLYGPEEMETIMTTCRRDCLAKRITPTKINIFAQVGVVALEWDGMRGGGDTVTDLIPLGLPRAQVVPSLHKQLWEGMMRRLAFVWWRWGFCTSAQCRGFHAS